MCLVKFKFDQHLFDKKILGGKKIKDTPFIGVRKINRKSDQNFFFQKMIIFIFSIKLIP